MKRYTLTYFDVRGRAEPIRLLFAYAGVDFEDHGINRENWPKLKSETPLGQIPFLVEHRPEGDRVIPQTMAILRHLARVHGVDGKTEDERLAADIAAETAVDLRVVATAFRFSPAFTDEAARAKYIDETAPVHFARLDKLLGDRPWFASATPTWADLYVFEMLGAHLIHWTGALEKWPRLAAFVRRVEELPQLSAYLQSRRPG